MDARVAAVPDATTALRASGKISRGSLDKEDQISQRVT